MTLLVPDTSDAVSAVCPASTRDHTFTLVRTAALTVVVLWHWLFATVRWDANGPHTGNPLHVVPAGFLLGVV